MAKSLYIDNTVLSQDKKKTYLVADISSGTILSVQNTTGFEANKNVLIGELGQQEAEILQTHSTTSPTGGTIYLESAPTYSHSADTPITTIDWNQFEVTWAATSSGTKTTLSYGTALLPTRKETIYSDSSKTSGYYFIRFVDTVGSAYSDYSDPIPYAGYPMNTVWSIKNRALNKVDAKIDDLITNDWLDDCLWEARREYHQAPGKRPFRRIWNQDIGNVGTGDYRVVLPSDIEKPTSGENIFGVRIGQNNIVHFYDKKEWDDDFRDTAHSYLLYDIGATSVTSFSVANARDFDTSGNVQIEDDVIAYTARDVSSGSFTVALTGTTHTANADVWQGISFGLPTKYTIFQNPGESAYIYFNCPIDTAYVDQNIWCDYYRTLVAKDSDADELDEPDYDMYIHYLAYRIKKKQNPSLDEHKDSDFLEWQRRKQLALSNEYVGSRIQFIPDID